MRTTFSFVAHHVVACDFRPQDCVVPVLHREKLVLEQDVRRARYVSCYENIVRDDTVQVEGAAASVASDAPEAGSQPGTIQPFDVADRAKRCQYHVDFERGSVGET